MSGGGSGGPNNNEIAGLTPKEAESFRLFRTTHPDVEDVLGYITHQQVSTNDDGQITIRCASMATALAVQEVLYTFITASLDSPFPVNPLLRFGKNIYVPGSIAADITDAMVQYATGLQSAMASEITEAERTSLPRQLEQLTGKPVIESDNVLQNGEHFAIEAGNIHHAQAIERVLRGACTKAMSEQELEAGDPKQMVRCDGCRVLLSERLGHPDMTGWLDAARNQLRVQMQTQMNQYDASKWAI